MQKLFTQLLFAFLFLSSASAFAQTPQLECDHPDFDALETIFFATGGEDWNRSDDWMTTCNPCSWYGVRCDANDRVSALALADNNLVGNLPPALGSLPFLTTFSAPNNALTGGIPAALLDLELWDLYLSNNQLSGSLPANIGDLEFLQYLRLDGNNFSGTLPASLADLGKLRELYLDGNNFSGNFPSGLGQSANLTVLLVRNNNLTGCLPEDLSNRCGNGNVRFTGNPGLPWSGDFTSFCASGIVSDQIGAPCNDGDPDTFDDTINGNCDCGPQPDGLTTADDELAQDQSDNLAPDNGGETNEGDADNTSAYSAPTGHTVTILARKMTIYPNPATGNQLNISLPNNEGVAALRLLSVTGSVVTERNFTGDSVQLNVPSLEAGMYFVEAVADGVRTVRRVMVE